MSMSVITLTSSSKTSISNPPETGRDASFSSYLDGAEETFVLKLAAARSHALSSSLPTSHDDREIDVFNAEKYFNDDLKRSPSKPGTKNPPIHLNKKDDPIEILQPPIAALSIRSESSWNSRSSLLHTLSRNHQPRKVTKKSFLATIGCNCSCINNNSTIDECVGENSLKSRKEHNNRDLKSEPDYNYVKFDEPELRVNPNGHFSFPVLKNKPGENGCLTIQEKFSILTFDAVASDKAEEIKIPSISSEMQHDSDSDASSDLFEIESFSRANPFHSRQASDGCRTPTNGYAPSEASIDWSVITASAADFAMLSDSEDAAANMGVPRPKKACLNSKPGPLKETPKHRPGIMSGCKNQKAVSVAGDAHRARTRPQSFDARVLSRSRPASLLYI